MKEKLCIERANPQNFNAFFELVRELARFEKLPLPTRAAKKRLKKDALQKKPRFESFVATLNGKPVGYLVFFLTYSTFLAKPTLFLEDVFVSKKFRSKGFGKRLFEFCIRKARKRKCGRVEWLALDWNKPAHDFYACYGAKPLNWLLFRLTEKQIEKVCREAGSNRRIH